MDVSTRIFEGTVVETKKTKKRFMVTKVNPRKYVMMDTDGKAGWNIDHSGVVRAENQTWEGPKLKTEYEKAQEAWSSGITLGTLVRVTGVHARKYSGLYAVIALRNNGTFNMAELGGDGGRYLRGFTVEQLEVVKPADVLK